MPTISLGRFRFTPRLATSVIALLVLTLLLRLGWWQLDRGREKDAMLAAAAAARAADVVDLGTTRATSALARHRARAEGLYDLTHQYLLDNQVHRGVAGYHVLTPLRIDGLQRSIVVNRGWVPVGASRDALPVLPGPPGPVQISGTLAGPPATGLLLGDSGYSGDGWPRRVQTVDLARIGADLGADLAPVLLRLDPGAEHGFEREWRTVRGIAPERHRAYAFQWFSLALALLVIYVVVNTRRTPLV